MAEDCEVNMNRVGTPPGLFWFDLEHRVRKMRGILLSLKKKQKETATTSTLNQWFIYIN